MSVMSRMSATALGAVVVVALAAAPAFAHSEFRPDRAAAGTTTPVNLFVENEQSDAGTVKVELHFPDDQRITLAALPTAPGWTTSVQGGSIGGPVTDVIWSRTTAQPEDVLVPITLGPLPSSAARLQFKVVQTYSNGEVDRWIEEWPAGAPEPEMPGPVLEVTGSASTTAAAPTVASTVPATAPPTTVAEPATTDDDDDSNAALPIIIAVIVILVGGAGAYLALRRRRSA